MGQITASESTIIRSALMDGLILLLAAILVPLVVIGDRHVFMHGLSEHSSTEILQAILTFLAAFIFWVRSIQMPEYRAWLQILGGFFTIILIRELDFYLDYVYHGFWSLLASLFLMLIVMLAWRSRNTLVNGLTHFLTHAAHVYIAIGVVIVILFSRIFGSGDFLMAIMQEQYDASFKTFVQEGLELLGYFLIAMGSVKYALKTETENPDLNQNPSVSGQ